jgi:hypothetical protein
MIPASIFYNRKPPKAAEWDYITPTLIWEGKNQGEQVQMRVSQIDD